MKILLTGATGYIGKRMLIELLHNNHHVVCIVRDTHRLQAGSFEKNRGKLEILEGDFLQPGTLNEIPADIEAAYYFLHSMADAKGDFVETEKITAQNFKAAIERTAARQVIYLTGIVNEEHLSKHLQSRKAVEEILKSERYALTALRAGIIVGSGSASFEIIRDLVEKLPVMVAPRWVTTRCQPIAIRNVIEFLTGVLGQSFTYNKHFDIAGKEVFTYKEMLLQFAAARGLKRRIITVPVLTPRLSSYWLYFITSTSYSLAKNLVNSMRVPVLAEKNDLAERLNIHLLSYREAIDLAFDKIAQNDVMSSWSDSFSNDFHSRNIWQYAEVPARACFRDKKQRRLINEEQTLDRIFGIGGNSGWYSPKFLWQVRGLLDKIFGGPGLRRGRRNNGVLQAGDTVDFWRVLFADRAGKRLLLFAEMKLPGEAWLEFRISNGILYQTATFRPRGLAGRLYWYAVYPFHFFVFQSMIRKLVGK